MSGGLYWMLLSERHQIYIYLAYEGNERDIEWIGSTRVPTYMRDGDPPLMLVTLAPFF